MAGFCRVTIDWEVYTVQCTEYHVTPFSQVMDTPTTTRPRPLPTSNNCYKNMATSVILMPLLDNLPLPLRRHSNRCSPKKNCSKTLKTICRPSKELEEKPFSDYSWEFVSIKISYLWLWGELPGWRETWPGSWPQYPPLSREGSACDTNSHPYGQSFIVCKRFLLLVVFSGFPAQQLNKVQARAKHKYYNDWYKRYVLLEKYLRKMGIQKILKKSFKVSSLTDNTSSSYLSLPVRWTRTYY